MLIQNMTDKEIQETLSQLDQTLTQHQQWFNHLVRKLACKLACELSYDQNEYSLTSKKPELNNIHKKLHQLAKKLVVATHNNAAISTEDYDDFTATLEKFNTEIYAYKKELELLLHHQCSAEISAMRITMLPILQEQQAFAKRQSQACSIAMLDIDLFDSIEIKHGKYVADKVLVTIANFLVEHVRTHDRVFYYSHQTFLISLQKVDAVLALDLMDRLRIKISNTPINVGSEEPLYITVSCGITVLDPALSIEQSLEQANITLYLAKTSGRNNAKLWSS